MPSRDNQSRHSLDRFNSDESEIIMIKSNEIESIRRKTNDNVKME
jgi:hypothetical protein